MTHDLYQPSMTFGVTNNYRKDVIEKNKPWGNGFLEAYRYVINLGTSDVANERQVKYIQISNFVALTSLLASSVYIVLAIFWRDIYWFAVVNGLGVSSAGVLFLNAIGRTRFSRMFFLVAVNVFLFLGALATGPVARSEDFLLVAVWIPFLIYDLRTSRLILAGVALPVILLLAYPLIYPYFTAYQLSFAQQELLHSLSVPMQIALSIAAVFQFMYYSHKSEDERDSAHGLLRQQATELKRSNDDLEQFAYVISHDLKGPVRNISSFMKLLYNKHGDSLNKEAKEFVDFSLTGARRMEQLIDDILSYSRVGRNLSDPQAFDLNEMMQTMRYEMRDRLRAQNAQIITSRQLPVINGMHSSLIYHVFKNLITNSLKFNNSDNPSVNVSWSDNETHYSFSVQDNGIGIDQEYKGKVFQMFKRLHNDGDYEGTGIGLAICKKIVEYYNGEIWYDSEMKGTTFHFTIQKG